MIIVGERINSSRNQIARAIREKDVNFIQLEAKKQVDDGADFIDVNAGFFVEAEKEYLKWLVEILVANIETPLCLDSPDPSAMAAALELIKGPVMLNSITLEKNRLEGMLPLIKKYQAKVIALCQNESGMASTTDEKVEAASELIKLLNLQGIPDDSIYIDPLVYPISTDDHSAVATIEAIGKIRNKYPQVHVICGLTNVSHGLPLRKLINRTFLVACMTRGLDAAILDPTDIELMSALLAAEALLGKDEFCMNFIKAYRGKRQ